jgi:hypothetical protein
VLQLLLQGRPAALSLSKPPAQCCHLLLAAGQLSLQHRQLHLLAGRLWALLRWGGRLQAQKHMHAYDSMHKVASQVRF